jgi:hypothetical protein
VAPARRRGHSPSEYIKYGYKNGTSWNPYFICASPGGPGGPGGGSLAEEVAVGNVAAVALLALPARPARV